MIIVTGAAGFIGSGFLWKLNQMGITDIYAVDCLASDEKWKNLRGKKIADYFEKDELLKLLKEDSFDDPIEAIFHLGACSATTEKNATYLIENNFQYSKILAEYAFKNNIYFSYASSAATYGDGELGYDDNHDILDDLCPMNMYGFSKHMFDLWLLRHDLLDRVVGLKFFNVFGPNEYHKEDMMSVVCKAHKQISQTGKVQLFKSHRPDYADGEQKRDFVYLKDVVDCMYQLYEKQEVKGIFNIGTGKARSWKDLVTAVFHAMGKEVNIEFIDMPLSIRNKYQYFTQANMNKLQESGVAFSFLSLEESVEDYVQGYLAKNNSYI